MQALFEIFFFFSLGVQFETQGPLPEVTIDDISENMKRTLEIPEAWMDIRITMEAAAGGMREFFGGMEPDIAV